MVTTYVLLAVGFIVLAFCADWLVAGASDVAKRFHISDLVIGLTIVAIGTSAPELVVNIFASYEGNNEIAMTNILGSNILNTLLILGITGVICPIYCSKRILRHEVPLTVAAGFIIMALGSDIFGQIHYGSKFVGLQRWNSILLIGGIIYFIGYTVKCAINDRKRGSFLTEVQEVKRYPLWLSITMIVVGLAGLTIGGKLIVDNATAIAKFLGVSDAVIGITVVALGTSLPELATSVVAAIKKNTDLAIGNVIGSNIFNVFFILGFSTLIRPIPTYKTMLFDAGMVTFSSLLLMIFLLDDKDHKLSRWESALMVTIYVAYVAMLIWQEMQ